MCAGTGPRGSGRRWAPGMGTGGRGACHCATAGEGPAEEHLQVLAGGNQAGDVAPLPQGAACHPEGAGVPVTFVLCRLVAVIRWK